MQPPTKKQKIEEDYEICKSEKQVLDCIRRKIPFRFAASLTELDLVFKHIELDTVSCIAEALKVNSTLTALNLTQSDIGNDGVRCITEALKVNSSLTKVNLKGNGIGIDGAIYIAEALKINSSLTELDLINNYIEIDGARCIAEALKVNSFITKIYLNCNGIGVGIGVGRVRCITEALALNKPIQQTANLSDKLYRWKPAIHNDIDIPQPLRQEIKMLMLLSCRPPMNQLPPEMVMYIAWEISQLYAMEVTEKTNQLKAQKEMILNAV